MTHLPSSADVGGLKFADELRIFCREFQPTITELRRLFMAKTENGWTKVSAVYPNGDVRLANPDWDHVDNAIYRGHVDNLSERMREAFPVRVGMTNIAACKQENGVF